MEKVSILVDVQNVYYTTRQAFGRHFDYNQFWANATAQRTVLHASAYAIAREDDKQKQFQNILRAIGFEVKLKPYIQRSDGSAKGDWDVGITLDAMEYAAQSDVVILVTGDGDFDLLVERIHAQTSATVEVYGVKSLTADSLIKAAHRFVEITPELLLNPASLRYTPPKFC